MDQFNCGDRDDDFIPVLEKDSTLVVVAPPRLQIYRMRPKFDGSLTEFQEKNASIPEPRRGLGALANGVHKLKLKNKSRTTFFRNKGNGMV